MVTLNESLMGFSATEFAAREEINLQCDFTDFTFRHGNELNDWIANFHAQRDLLLNGISMDAVRLEIQETLGLGEGLGEVRTNKILEVAQEFNVAITDWVIEVERIVLPMAERFNMICQLCRQSELYLPSEVYETWKAIQTHEQQVIMITMRSIGDKFAMIISG